jgi:hypothetical protein
LYTQGAVLAVGVQVVLRLKFEIKTGFAGSFMSATAKEFQSLATTYK